MARTLSPQRRGERGGTFKKTLRPLFVFGSRQIVPAGVLYHWLDATHKGNPMKILIAADMEGVTGVVNWDQVNPSHAEYARFRKLMT